MITPVILAGSSGTRLWPVLRKRASAQCPSLSSDESLFAQTLARVSGAAFGAPTVVTGSAFEDVAVDQVARAGAMGARIVVAPEGGQSGAALLAAALLHAQTPDAVLLVCPADMDVTDCAAFETAVTQGAAAAARGAFVTFGVQPTYAETGYCYLELQCIPKPGDFRAVSLRTFVQKPDRARALAMVAGGRHLWNAGIFMFRVSSILAAFDAHGAGMIQQVGAAVTDATRDGTVLRLDRRAMAAAEDISIDRVVMEQSAGPLQAVPLAAGWSGLGNWRALQVRTPRDVAGKALFGAAVSPERLEVMAPGLRLGLAGERGLGLGMEGIARVITGDGVTLIDVDQSARVRGVIAALKTKDRKQATRMMHPQAAARQIMAMPEAA